MPRELRDIVGNYSGEPDIAYIQRKIAAAGEMKTAIKRFYEEWTLVKEILSESHPAVMSRLHRNAKKLKKSMEDYLNVE